MRNVRWIASLVGIVALGIMGVGCGPQEPIEGGKPNPKPIKTLVSLSPSTTEVLSTAGLYSQMKGRTEACDWPTTILNVPVVAGVKPNYEEIAKIKPDIAVYDPELFSEADIQKLKEIGVEPWPFPAKSYAEYIDSVYRLGTRTGTESLLSGYLDRVNAAKVAAEGDPLDPAPTVVVILPGASGSEHMIAGLKTFPADIVRIAGGNVLGPDAGQFEKLSAEQLVSWNPDIILVAGEADRFVTDPRFTSLKAIRERKITAINQDVVLRAGTRVDKFIETAHRALASRFN